ncbi:MAG TPA: TULIP family P47-like protein [Longimicrobium sp.]|jgi:hypothetical protein
MNAPTLSSFNTTTFASNTGADTFGWDVVYVLNASVINDSLADYFAKGGFGSALAFDETCPTLPGLPSAYMKGQFGPWQVTTGGAGDLISLTIPIASGSFGTVGGESGATDLAGGSVTVQVKLGFHPVPSAPASSAATGAGAVTAALKIVTGGAAPSAGSAADIRSSARGTAAPAPTTLPETVSVTAISVPAIPNGDSFQANAVKTMTEQWMQNHLQLFDYVFLTVDVAESAAHGEWSWILPTYVGYAYTDVLDADGGTSIDNALIGIMSLTEGRTPGSKNVDGSIVNVSQEISAAGIPNNSGVNAALLLNPALVVDKVITPNMPALFENAKDTDFSTSWPDKSVTNVKPLTLELNMDPSWYPFSNPCTATIPAGDLQVQFNQTSVQQSFNNISFPYGAQNELTIEVSLVSTSTVGLDENGHFTMQYDRDSISTLSAQPDAKKISEETLEGLGVTLVVTALCCLSFGAAGGEAAETVESGTQTATELEPAAEEPNVNNLSSEQESLASEIDSSLEGGSKADGSVEMVNEGENNIGPAQIKTELGTSAQAEMRNPGTWTFKGIAPRFTFKVWSMIVGQLSGQLYSDMSSIDTIAIYDQDPTKMPTLRNFLAACISPATWTNTGDQELLCAGLNGAFVMGFAVPPRPSGAPA